MIAHRAFSGQQLQIVICGDADDQQRILIFISHHVSLFEILYQTAGGGGSVAVFFILLLILRPETHLALVHPDCRPRVQPVKDRILAAANHNHLLKIVVGNISDRSFKVRILRLNLSQKTAGIVRLR